MRGLGRRVGPGVCAWVCALALAPPAAAAVIDLRDDVEGTPHDDVLRGTPRDDRLWSGGGRNWLFGLGGDDRMHAGPARDELYGGAGSDRMRGRAGADLAVPGPGGDLVAAGPGRDRVQLSRDRRIDRLDCGPGPDVVGYRAARDPYDRLVGCERVVTRGS